MRSLQFKALQPAQVHLDPLGTPFSDDFGDIFFSREQGLAESRYVFLDHNRLPERFEAAQGTFRIGELGFGTGLNFLATWQAWQQHRPAQNHSCLEYWSIEKHPLSAQTLAAVHEAWPELKPWVDLLCRHWPLPVQGIHRLELGDARTRLYLVFGEVEDWLGQWPEQPEGSFDAWFLDGFAPRKNPGMWQAPLFSQLALLSRPGATLATFTAAGFVRRGLMDAGFAMRKTPGFGTKREMLCGELVQRPGPEASRQAGWLTLPHPGADPIAIIGAGVAGVATARALQQRGRTVLLFEQGNEPGPGASGNPAALFSPLLSADMNLTSQIYLQGFCWLENQLRGYDDEAIGRQKGLWIQDDKGRWRQAKQRFDLPDALLVPREAGVYMPLAGSLQPRALLQHWLAPLQAAGTWFPGTRIQVMQADAGGWSLHLADGRRLQVGQVVVCCGAEGPALFPPLGDLLQKAKGQISHLQASGWARLPLASYGSYQIPLRDGLLMGAGYRVGDPSVAEDPQMFEDYGQRVAAFNQLAFNEFRQLPWQQRVSFRAITQDRLPLIGPLPDPSLAVAQLAGYAGGLPDHRVPAPSLLPGLWLNTGHGARGFTLSLLAAESLAAQICGEIPPLAKVHWHALWPGRFLLRQLRALQTQS